MEALCGAGGRARICEMFEHDHRSTTSVTSGRPRRECPGIPTNVAGLSGAAGHCFPDAGHRTTREPTSRRFPTEGLRFNPDVGEWGHCEAVALSRYDQVVHDWLDGVLAG